MRVDGVHEQLFCAAAELNCQLAVPTVVKSCIRRSPGETQQTVLVLTTRRLHAEQDKEVKCARVPTCSRHSGCSQRLLSHLSNSNRQQSAAHKPDLQHPHCLASSPCTTIPATEHTAATRWPHPSTQTQLERHTPAAADTDNLGSTCLGCGCVQCVTVQAWYVCLDKVTSQCRSCCNQHSTAHHLPAPSCGCSVWRGAVACGFRSCLRKKWRRCCSVNDAVPVVTARNVFQHPYHPQIIRRCLSQRV